MLGHCQTQQLGIRELVFAATPNRWIIGRDDFIGDKNVQCYQEGVELFVHNICLTPSNPL